MTVPDDRLAGDLAVRRLRMDVASAPRKFLLDP